MCNTRQSSEIQSRTLLKRLLVVTALAIAVGTITACSTTEGFGNDVKHLGGNIEDGAARNK